jgi:dolichol-phosphate mannosyltransferase
VVDALLSLPVKGQFLGGLMSWMAFSIEYIPVDMEKRFSGETKYNIYKLFTHAINGILSFSIFPLRLAIFMGIIFSVASFLLGIAMVIQRLMHPEMPSGYTSLFVSIVFIGGVVLFSVGIVGEYVGRIYEVVRGRPEYLVDKVI